MSYIKSSVMIVCVFLLCSKNVYTQQDLAQSAYNLNMGLLALDTEGGSVKRDTWESNSTLASIAHEVIPDEALRLVIKETLGIKAVTQASIATIKTLKASNKGISNLKGLEFAVNLEELWISRNPITNLSPLAGCVNLVGLEAQRVPISDLSPLAELTKLEWLECDRGSISDISPIRDLKNLRRIRLTRHRIRDISPLSGLVNLEDIAISVNEISDISRLSGLKGLKVLRMGDNKISDISPIRKLTNLTVLELRSNNVRDITPLEDLENLKTLDLFHNGISDISSLEGLYNLEDLNLSHNKISNVSHLKNLRKLRNLDLTHNLIQDIAPLARLLENKNTNVYLPENPGSPRGGPKIEGPWHWAWIPAAHHHGWDMLAKATNGAVTESRIANYGAMKGERVASSVWTSHKLSPTGNNNIRQLTNDLGWAPERELYSIVLYGCINLYSPREQETTMHVGCDDGAKIWLNGEAVFRKTKHDGSLEDYNTFFPVTLKEGKNILFVALDDRNYRNFSAFFGFDVGAKYTLSLPSVGYSLPESTIYVGDTFSVNIKAENVLDLAGWKFEIKFNPSVIEAIAVSEGDFLKTGNVMTFFQGGNVDNVKGKITSLSASRLDQSGVHGTGTLLKTKFMAKSVGKTKIELKKLKLGSITGEKISLEKTRRVEVNIQEQLSNGDVNRDGQIDISDLILISKYVGKDVPEDLDVDVNNDGVVNALDLNIVSRAIEESPSAPMNPKKSKLRSDYPNPFNP